MAKPTKNTGLDLDSNQVDYIIEKDNILEEIFRIDNVLSDLKDAIRFKPNRHDLTKLRIKKCTTYDDDFTWEFDIYDFKYLEQILIELTLYWQKKRDKLIIQFNKEVK